MRHTLLLALLLALPATTALAGEGPRESLWTDRPGNANAPTAVRPDTVQLETSFNFSLDDLDSGDHGFSFPTFVRFGVSDRAELRVGHSLWGVSHVGGELSGALPDLVVGTKFELSDPSDGPWLGVSLDLQLPTGQAAATAGGVYPDLRLISVVPLPANLAILANAILDLPDAADGDRALRGSFVVNLGWSTPIEGVSIFAEVFGRFAMLGQVDPIAQIDAGASWLLTDDVQLDFFTQHPMLPGSPPFQLALGFSTRL